MACGQARAVAHLFAAVAELQMMARQELEQVQVLRLGFSATQSLEARAHAPRQWGQWLQTGLSQQVFRMQWRQRAEGGRTKGRSSSTACRTT